MGLLVQPLHIIHASFLLSGQGNIVCNLDKVLRTVTGKCLTATFTHSILMSAERYVAVKHSFVHENRVTVFRIIIASSLAWVIALLLPTEDVLKSKTDFASNFIVFIVVPVLLYFLLFRSEGQATQE